MKKEQIVITGKAKYIDYMYEHLREEHPKTKSMMIKRLKR